MTGPIQSLSTLLGHSAQCSDVHGGFPQQLRFSPGRFEAGLSGLFGSFEAPKPHVFEDFLAVHVCGQKAAAVPGCGIGRDLLGFSNGTLERRYSRIMLLSKAS